MTVEKLKSKLEELANKDFYLEMQDGWSNKQFELSEEIHKEIKEVINKLAKYGIEAIYKLGYDIEYYEI